MDDKKLDDETAEANFNESELEEIMSEIEDLENSPDTSAEDEMDQAISMSVEELEKELAALEADDDEQEIDESLKNKHLNEVMAEAVSEEAAFDEIVSNDDSYDMIEKSENVELNVSGPINVEFNYSVGDAMAKVSLVQGQGIKIDMAECHISISEEEGCVIEMASGVKFSLPISESKGALKKAA